MKIYYYAHTGHRIGLDRFRRAAALITCMKQECEIILLTSDYRIASIAREYGIDHAVGVDVVRNIANIAYQGDKLIFDSDEANPIMLEDMREYFSSFIRLSDKKDEVVAPNEYLISPYLSDEENVKQALIVDEKYFGTFTKDVALTYFFGDDDYEKDLEKHIGFVEGLDPYLQLGFYYFLDYEAQLKKRFSHYFEFDDYENMIQRTDILITASPQAVLESLASGGRPIYFQREDYPKDYIALFQTLGIPVIKDYNKQQLQSEIANISQNNYHKIEKNCYQIEKILKKWLDL
jgi:hypothetical protein